MSEPLPPDAPDLSATQYSLEKLLGEGGFGQAYLAYNRGLKRRCVIKLLTDITNTGFVARFYREAQVMANLEHHSIPRIYEVATTKDGRPYFVMEFIDGKSLGEHLADEGGLLPVAEACRIVADAAEGLAAAHEVGVIHRDIKLANLLVNKRGQLKIIDFGIARKTIEEGDNTPGIFTRQGELLGTPRYMSPEQCMAKPIGPPSDLYSLGIVLFILLTGQSPIDGQTPLEMMTKHVSEPAPRLSDVAGRMFPAHLEWIIGRLLEKDPNARFASGNDLAKELRSIDEQRDVAPAAPRTSPAHRADLPTPSRTDPAPAVTPSIPPPEATVMPSGRPVVGKQTDLMLGGIVRAMLNESSVMVPALPDVAAANGAQVAQGVGGPLGWDATAYAQAQAATPSAQTLEMPVVTPALPSPVVARPRAAPMEPTPSSVQTTVGIAPRASSWRVLPLVAVGTLVAAALLVGVVVTRAHVDGRSDAAPQSSVPAVKASATVTASTTAAPAPSPQMSAAPKPEEPRAAPSTTSAPISTATTQPSPKPATKPPLLGAPPVMPLTASTTKSTATTPSVAPPPPKSQNSPNAAVDDRN